jgi:hypothetical protein
MSIKSSTLVVWMMGLMLLAVTSLWFVLQAAWIDASTLSARTTVNGWRDGSGPRMTSETWIKTRDKLKYALGEGSGNAQLYDDLGYLYAARSQSIGVVPINGPAYQIQQSLMDLAIQHYRTACELRPTFPYSWTYLALAKNFREQHDDEFWIAFDNALQFGRNEAALQGAIGEMAFALWSVMGTQRQQIVIVMVTTAKEELRNRLFDAATQAGVQLVVE